MYTYERLWVAIHVIGAITYAYIIAIYAYIVNIYMEVLQIHPFYGRITL